MERYRLENDCSSLPRSCDISRLSVLRSFIFGVVTKETHVIRMRRIQARLRQQRRRIASGWPLEQLLKSSFLSKDAVDPLTLCPLVVPSNTLLYIPQRTAERHHSRSCTQNVARTLWQKFSLLLPLYLPCKKRKSEFTIVTLHYCPRYTVRWVARVPALIG